VRIAMATHNGISQSTAHTIKRDVLAEFQADFQAKARDDADQAPTAQREEQAQ